MHLDYFQTTSCILLPSRTARGRAGLQTPCAQLRALVRLQANQQISWLDLPTMDRSARNPFRPLEAGRTPYRPRDWIRTKLCTLPATRIPRGLRQSADRPFLYRQIQTALAPRTFGRTRSPRRISCIPHGALGHRKMFGILALYIPPGRSFL